MKTNLARHQSMSALVQAHGGFAARIPHVGRVSAEKKINGSVQAGNNSPWTNGDGALGANHGDGGIGPKRSSRLHGIKKLPPLAPIIRRVQAHSC